jgi:hypothetical protein
MAEYKKQHYVPQVYLRRFTTDGERLFVFDKLHEDPARRIRRSKVRDIAHENDFYDIVPEVLKPEFRPDHNRKMIENLLGRFDAELGSGVEQLVAAVKSGRRLDVNQRALLARAMGIQAVRTRDTRDTIEELYLQGYGAILRDITARNFPGDEDLTPRAVMKPGFLPMYHARYLLESGINKIGKAFMEHTWIIGVNKTKQLLYTSDQPVVRFAHIEDPHLSNEGFAAPGIEVAFPLDSEHLLIMRDRRAPYGDWAYNWSVVELNDDNVEFYNRMQIEQSRRQIYCRDNAFNLASQMCTEDPELTDPTGRKVTVEIIPSEDPLRSYIVTNIRATRKKKSVGRSS